MPRPRKTYYCKCGCGRTCKRYFSSDGSLHGRHSLYAPDCEKWQPYNFQKPVGAKKDHQNYITVKVERGRWQLEHRAVMERNLGRALDSIEVVHHINGDGRDNRLQNLELTTQADHTYHHHKISTWSKKYVACVECGETRQPHNAHGRCKTCYMRSYNRSRLHSSISRPRRA